ncbi:MAG: hypothetical protein QXW13_00730 [Nanopusillaceae archaeon]
MDIGEFLNIILMLLIISFSIIITARFAFLNMKYMVALNPFTIYQIAISINYFSSNVGDFLALIETPGMEFIEYRISSYSKGILGYRPAYVSSGICTLKDHVQELFSDVINALYYTIAGGAFVGVGKMPAAAMIKAFLKTAIIETARIYFFSKLFEGIFTLLPIFGSGKPIELKEMFTEFVRLRSYFSNPAKLAEEVKNDFLSGYAQTAVRIVVSGAIRVIISKALTSTGIVGFAIAFFVNFLIEVADNIAAIIRGKTDPEYDCLYTIINGFGKQVIYVQMERIEYTPNLNINLEFISVTGCKDLSKYVGNVVYKITGYQPCEDEWAYLLKNITIYKDENSKKTSIKANYEKVKK